MSPSTLTLATDLVPWWFAAAFWLAFAGLVTIVVRDIRRMGGFRAVARALREAMRSPEE